MINIGNQPSSPALPPNLDLSAAPDLYHFLQTILTQSPDHLIVVDGAPTERVSTACIQVLLAASAECEATGRRLRLERPSEELASAFGNLGLEEQLARLCAD